MGRWRPPQKPGSPYITAEGASRLREEVQYLWRKLRPEVVKALAAAAAEGDRSENAEYTYRKKQLGEIDRRSTLPEQTYRHHADCRPPASGYLDHPFWCLDHPEYFI